MASSLDGDDQRHSTALDALAAIVGRKHVISGVADRDGFDKDWRGRLHGRSLAVVRPAATAEVAQLVTACREHGLTIVPQGGNTGMCGGATPDESGSQIVVSLERMRTVREVDTDCSAMTLEAGVPLQMAQDTAAAAGLCFPLSIASEGSATIGGVVATNAGGINVLRYGTTRDLTLGLEVVLADGTVWSGLSKLRKDNTGYDLKHLFIGSEGTLGIVTAACLKLYPQPRHYVTFLAGLASPQTAVAALNALRAHAGDTATSWELFSATSVDLLAAHCPTISIPLTDRHRWYLLGEISLFDDAAEEQDRSLDRLASLLEAMQISDVAVASSRSQRADLWTIREAISEAEKAQGQSVKHDISVPVSAIAEFAADIEAAFEARFPDARLNVFGHIGDGNLHINAVPRKPGGRIDPNRVAAISRWIYEGTAERGGSFSAEHGIGSLKRGEMAQFKTGTSLAMMRAIKAALDPGGLFNPGKLLP